MGKEVPVRITLMHEPIETGKGTNSGINEHHQISRGFPHELLEMIHLFKIVTTLSSLSPSGHAVKSCFFFPLHGNIEGAQDGHAEGDAKSVPVVPVPGPEQG